MNQITPEHTAAIWRRIKRAESIEDISETEKDGLLGFIATDCRWCMEEIDNLIAMLTHAVHLNSHNVPIKSTTDTNHCKVCREIILRTTITSQGSG
jgi:CRISPR/Cas system-associated protein Csm6